MVFTMKNVSKSFADRTLFSDVNLRVEGGERIALLGTTARAKPHSSTACWARRDCQGKIAFGPIW